MPPIKLVAPTPTRTSPAACRWRALQPPTMLHLPSHFLLTRKRAVSSMDMRWRWTVVGPATEAGSLCASAIAKKTSLTLREFGRSATRFRLARTWSLHLLGMRCCKRRAAGFFSRRELHQFNAGSIRIVDIQLPFSIFAHLLSAGGGRSPAALLERRFRRAHVGYPEREMIENAETARRHVGAFV